MSIKGNANLCEKEKVVVIEYPNIDRVEKNNIVLIKKHGIHMREKYL